jgi:hypothetical protein
MLTAEAYRYRYAFSGTITSRSGDIPSASAWKFMTTR